MNVLLLSHCSYHNLCDQSKSDLEASENRCAAISKECDLAQEKVNQLREANCNLEAQLSEERKKLREANLTIHRLQTPRRLLSVAEASSTLTGAPNPFHRPSTSLVTTMTR